MKDFHPCQTCPNLDGCVCEHLQTTLCGSHYEWCANCGAIRRLGGSRQPLMAWQLPALAEAPQETGPAQPWKGKLHHARTLCDDWGTIRDESGRLILTVMVPPSADIEGWDKYRRNNTDPTQPIVDAILAALNGQNDQDHAARRLGLQAIGIELRAGQCAEIVKRLAQGELSLQNEI